MIVITLNSSPVSNLCRLIGSSAGSGRGGRGGGFCCSSSVLHVLKGGTGDRGWWPWGHSWISHGTLGLAAVGGVKENPPSWGSAELWRSHQSRQSSGSPFSKSLAPALLSFGPGDRDVGRFPSQRKSSALTQLLGTLVSPVPRHRDRDIRVVFQHFRIFPAAVFDPVPIPCPVLPVSHLPLFSLSSLWGLSLAWWALSPADHSHFHLQGSPQVI